MVIFGGTGDLANRKLYPAVYNLYLSGQLPENFALLSVGRRDKDDFIFREEAKAAINSYSRKNYGNASKLNELLQHFYYYKMDFTDCNSYYGLKKRLESFDKKYNTMGNRIFYLAVAPEYFEPITKNIYACGINVSGGWERLVIEKPFGTDLTSARKLNQAITSTFNEEQIYRIDHFLGKEMLQNIMVIRFANALFEPLWNNKYINNIQVTSSETIGVENRGGYYDKAGALRDMMQNHMLQLLMLIAMEPPISLDTGAIRDEKVKVLRTLAPMTEDYIRRNVVRGQYGEGFIDNRRVVGYRQEERVSPESNTETYMAMKVEIENFRWAGVPFYLRTGKRLPKKITRIVIEFKQLPGILYYKEFNGLEANRLIIEIQPREGVVLKFNGKRPGPVDHIIPVEMDFCQNCAIGAISPDAYERLLYDVMRGDSTLFTRWDEVEHSWAFIDNISNYWLKESVSLPNYAAGTWGPAEADDLLKRDGRYWVND